MARMNRWDPTGEKTEDLKRATREANETLADVKRTLKEARSLISEMRQYIDERVSDKVETAVADHVARLGEATEKAMNESVDKCFSEFQKLEDIMLGHDKGEPLEDLIRRGICKQHGVHRSLCRRMVHSEDTT